MIIAGIDEVGRGPLAGPVVAACVAFQEGFHHPDIKDSKKLTAPQREMLVPLIKQSCRAWSIIAVGHQRIGAINIRNATKLAMSLAAKKVRADLYRIDGNMRIDIEDPQETIVGGDDSCVEISAASILAKVWRDSLMKVLCLKYPGYGFAGHVGYSTPAHLRALEALGPSRVHRRGFAPVDRSFLRAREQVTAAALNY